MLSSLQSQLAALKNPSGTAVASNRKHDQAVGRGVHFSVQTGKRMEGDSHRFQASLIYESTREAADVPLSTLKTQYENSLAQINRLDLLEAAARLEKATSPKAVRSLIVGVLSLLASELLESPNSESDAVLHCLEYLLRAYQLHTAYPLDLLWTVMAASDHPKLQQRVLELIDWAEHQSYLWLRPYVAAGTFPSRNIISQYVMKETTILKSLCVWSTSRMGNHSPKFLSFTAAILIQGMENVKETREDQIEPMLRIIIPAIAPKPVGTKEGSIVASSNDTMDLPRWQLVVASAVAEAVPLSQALVDFLCTRILASRNDILHSLGCVVSILLARQTPTHIIHDQLKYMLEVPSKEGGEASFIGCTQLSQSIATALLRINNLAGRLRELNMVIAPLVASLALRCELDSSMPIQERNQRILDLLELEPHLVPAFITTRKLHSDCEKALRNQFKLVDDPKQQTDSLAYHASIEWLLAQSPPAWSAIRVRLSSRLGVAVHDKTLMVQAAFANYESICKDAVHSLAYCGNEALPILVASCSLPKLETDAKESIRYNTQCGHAVERWMVENSGLILDAKIPTGCESVVRGCIQTIASSLVKSSSQIGTLAKQNLYQLFCDFLLAQTQQLPEAQNLVFRKVLNIIFDTFSNEQVVDSIASLSQCTKKILRTIVAPLIHSLKLKCNISQVSVPEDALLLECALSSKARSDWLVSLIKRLSCDVSLIQALALLKVGNDSTRNAIVNLLRGQEEESNDTADKISKAAKAICRQISGQETAAKMGGPNFMLHFLSKTTDAAFITSLWVYIALGRLDDSERNQWLSTSAAAVHIAQTMELVEEEKFHLLKRWQSTGEPLLPHLEKLPEDLQMFIFRMMKGVVARKPQLVVSTGPSGSGGRTRSYSIGSEDIVVLKPYPKSMLDVIQKVLTESDATVATRLVHVVFKSQTWREKVFQSLKVDQKLMVVSAFATYLCEKNSDYEAQDAFYKLTLTADEIITLFNKMKDQVGPLSLLVEYIGENAKVVVSSKNACVSIVSHLFDNIEDPRWKESFVLQGMITTLRKLFDCVATSDNRIEIKKALLDQWSTCLISLFVESTSVFSKLRPGILSLLVCMCPLSPSQLVEPIVQCVLVCLDDSSEIQVSTITEMVVPVYLQHISATRQTTIHLYTSMLGRLSQKKNYTAVISAICRSLREIRSPNPSSEIASFLLTVIAQGISESSDNVTACREIFCTELRSFEKLSLIHEFLEYVYALIVVASKENFQFNNSDRTDEQRSEIQRCCGHLVDLASRNSDKQVDAKLVLGLSIMRLVNEALIDTDVEAILNDMTVGSTSSSKLIQIWQIVLPIEFAAQKKLTGDETMERYDETAIVSTISEVRNTLQHVLPPKDFVASIRNIISSTPDAGVQSQAFQIFADQADSIHELQTDEVTMFLSLVPVAVESVRRLEGKEDSEASSLVIQAALVSIEQLARACGPNLRYLRCDQNTKRKTISHFKSSLESCTKLVQDQNRNTELICSGGLCAATLIRVLLSDSLPSLSKLFKALVSKLTGEDFSGKDFTSALFQVSMLRPMISIVETMPRFISSSLPLIPKVLLTPRLLGSTDMSVVESLNRLETVLVNGVEPRLLLPTMTQALSESKAHGAPAVLLRIIHQSTLKASGLCISGHLPSLVASIFMGLEETTTRNAGGDILIAMILKMNEPQLKNVYRQLRDWSVDKSDNRQIAFWSVSCRLAKELKSIFLPCFTMVFPDLVTTLGRVSRTGEPPSKKRRTAQDSVVSKEVLSSAVSALEQVLRADSRQGGQWLRNDGSNDRFESILECLDCLLLHAPDVDPLVSCVTALGLAAGDDVFWKPLNHCVLLVCQVEGSPASVRSGLECLLALMKALGEEYMTLLPEILPVLAELLEDANEDIATMARAVVTYAESLTGEDLEERLR